MQFPSKANHYFRYQRADQEAANRSSEGDFYAWSSRRPSVRKGDFVWVLARKGETNPGRYEFAYVFRSEGEPKEIDGRWQLHGTDGQSLAHRGVVQGLPWFDEFFRTMGRGGTSVQPIPERYLPQLLEFVGLSPSPVDIDADIGLAEVESRVEDAVALRAIKTRRGQGAFRDSLLSAYEGRCCITGCAIEPLLEAAHITAHADDTDYRTSNGLLLRADIHTLFDLGLLTIEPNGRIRVSQTIKDPQYRSLEGVGRIRPPRSLRDNPSEDGLRRRMARFVS